jgi:hypothetical protein
MNFEIFKKFIKNPNLKRVSLWTMFLDLRPYRKHGQSAVPWEFHMSLFLSEQ